MSEELQVSPTIPLSPAMENQVREKRGPGLLFSCVPCTQPREGGLCPFFLGFDLGLHSSSSWVAWDSAVFPFFQKVPLSILESHWAHGCASAKADGIAKLSWGKKCPSLSPRTAASIVKVPGEWGNWNMKSLSLNWKSHSFFSLKLSLEYRVGSCL